MSQWQATERGLPKAWAIRAVAVDPRNPANVHAGTQSVPYRSADRGREESWHRGSRIPVSERFQEITTAPGPDPAKCVLMLDTSVNPPNHLYAAIEVGGMIPSPRSDENCENLCRGQHLNADAVHMPGVLICRWRPGSINGDGRAGMFRSTNGYALAACEARRLNSKGQICCLDIHEVSGNPHKRSVTEEANLQSDKGTLFYSSDGGDAWKRVELPHTLLALVFDEHYPKLAASTTNGGEAYSNTDSRGRWIALPSPPAGTQFDALARG